MVSQRCSVLCVSLLLALGSISWPHHMSGSYLWGLRLFPPSCPAFWVAPFRHLTSRDIHERSLPSSLRVLQETAPGRYLVSSPVLEAGRQIACNLEVTWVIRNDVCVVGGKNCTCKCLLGLQRISWRMGLWEASLLWDVYQAQRALPDTDLWLLSPDVTSFCIRPAVLFSSLWPKYTAETTWRKRDSSSLWFRGYHSS